MARYNTEGIMLEEYTIEIDDEEILANIQLVQITYGRTEMFLVRYSFYEGDYENPDSAEESVTLSKGEAYEKYIDWKKKAKQFIIDCLGRS